jgi:hypothetical protein
MPGEANMRKFGPCAIPIPGPLNVRLVTFYVQDAGYGDTDLIMYMHAEAALERCLERVSVKACGALSRKPWPLYEELKAAAEGGESNSSHEVSVADRRRSRVLDSIRTTRLGMSFNVGQVVAFY